MKVVSLVNGSLLSEAASFYAILYAQACQLPLTLLFIDNHQEDSERALNSMETLSALCEAHQVECDRVVLEGGLVSQTQTFCNLYAVDTLFCATQPKSNSHALSDKIVQAGLETNIAVVKIKNIAQIRSFQNQLFITQSQLNLHAFSLWLGLAFTNEAKTHLLIHNDPKTLKHFHGKSGLKYNLQPFVNLAKMVGRALEVEDVLHPLTVAELVHFTVENSVDLVMYDAQELDKKLLNQTTDLSPVNSVLFYGWGR